MKLLKGRFDGWINLLTNLGRKGYDKTQSTKFQNTTILRERELADLYRSEGFARRIVDLPAREMTRKGFVVSGDTNSDVIKEMKRLGIFKATRDMLKWTAVFGGSLGVLWIDDGGELKDELNEGAIKKIEMIRVYDRWRVDRSTGIDREPASKTFLQTKFYRVSPPAGVQFDVDSSRTVLLDGQELPPAERAGNAYWGDSVFQSIYNYIKRQGASYGIAENILEDFSTGILSIENLQEMISSGQEELVQKRLQFLDMSRHVINTLLLDAKEKYEKRTTSIAGLPEMIDRFAQSVSSVTGIPMTLLMGQSPKGMTATGESDVRLWYDNVKSNQEEMLEPLIRRLAQLIMLQKMGPFHGKELENWAIKFNPLWEMSEKEEAGLRKTVAEADEKYINIGVLTPDEVAVSRFGGDEYSMQTHIDIEDRKPPEGE